MKRIITVLAAIVTGVLASGMFPNPAMAEAPAVPDEVIHWFNTVAPAVVRGHSLPSPNATAGADGHYIYPFGSTVGKPVTIMWWTDEFLGAARTTVDMFVPEGDWMAPVTSHGQGVGTIRANIDGNGQWQYMWDNDASAAAALMAARPNDMVVTDSRNGVFIIADNTVRQYGSGRTGTVPSGTVAQLQAALRAQQADDAAQVAAAGGQEVTGAAPLDFAQWVKDHPDPLAPVVAAPGLNPWWIAGPVATVLLIGAGAALLVGRRYVRRASH